MPGALRCNRCWEIGTRACRSRWSASSTRSRVAIRPGRRTGCAAARLVEELTTEGHAASERGVNRLLQALGGSLQANLETPAGRRHPNRGAQFQHIYRRMQGFRCVAQTVVSMERKRQELGAGTAMEGGSGVQEGSRKRCERMTSPVRNAARQFRGESATWPQTPRGSASARVMAPPQERWKRCGAGGGKRAGGPVPRRCGCRSHATEAVATAAAGGYGSWSCQAGPANCNCGCRRAISLRRPASGTRSSTTCYARSWRTGAGGSR